MKIVMILVPLMLVLVALGILLFSWAVRNGQYDDLDGPAHRILYDDDEEMIPGDARQKKTTLQAETNEHENQTSNDKASESDRE